MIKTKKLMLLFQKMMVLEELLLYKVYLNLKQPSKKEEQLPQETALKSQMEQLQLCLLVDQSLKS